MKRIFLLLITISVLCSFTLFQDVADPKAQKILSSIKTKYTSYKNLKVDFKFTLTDKELDEPEEFEGKIYLKDKKFRLETDQMDIVSNNKFLWMHLKSANRLQIQDYDPAIILDEFGFQPDQIFTVKEDDFFFKLNGTVDLDGEQTNEIELTPKDKEKPYYKIKMYSTLADNKVVKVVFYESQALYSIIIEDQVPNTEMAESTFSIDDTKFDKNKIEDLRTR